MSQERELFEWMKASKEKSNHQQRVCCRGLKHGHFFEASYDKSIDMYINYTSGTSSNRIPVDLIEWLKPITKPESITNSSIEQMALDKYCSPHGNPNPETYAFIAGCKAIIELNKKNDE